MGDQTVPTLRDRLTRDIVIYSNGEGFHKRILERI